MMRSQLSMFAAIVFLFFVAFLLLFLILIQPNLYVVRVSQYYLLNKKIIARENLNALLASRWDMNSSQRLLDYLAGWKYSVIRKDNVSEEYYKKMLNETIKKLAKANIITGLSYNLTWIGVPCSGDRVVEIFLDKGAPVVVCLPHVKP